MAFVNYGRASTLLTNVFSAISSGLPESYNEVYTKLNASLDIVFASNTQSYREVLLGCALIHKLHPEINIRLPYVKQGEDAFNGRTLDEKVVNPFLVSKQIPCSKGPYLATFRRNVKLDETCREGLRDKAGYDAMLEILAEIEASVGEDSTAILYCLLRKFYELRENSEIRLVSVARMSVEQYRKFLDILLYNQSGGLIPMLVTEAIFQTINESFNCGWTVCRQGINAADGATGAPGDVVINRGTEIVKAIEVTERPIASTRVVTTFNTKIATNDVREYLFIYTQAPPEEEAYRVANAYFAQGYDINFIKLTNLVISTFIGGDAAMRAVFMNKMLGLLRGSDVPASVKTAWNDSLQSVINA